MAMWSVWGRRWGNMMIAMLLSLFVFNCFLFFKVISQRYLTEEDNLGKHKPTPVMSLRDLTKDGKINFIPTTSVCSYNSKIYYNKKPVDLNVPPFDVVMSSMNCLMNGIGAIFGKEFAFFNSAILDPAKTINGSRAPKGGEKLEDVWGQQEEQEYISQLPGYFTIPCEFPPFVHFDEMDFKFTWAKNLQCHDVGLFNEKQKIYNNSTRWKNKTTPIIDRIPGLTFAFTRFEYANFYHAMTDFYNAFVLKLILSTGTENVNILLVDAHPNSTLDAAWTNLFGKVIRAGKLTHPTMFEKLVWGIQGYRSPLNNHHSDSVPFLEEFRHFFLTRHGIHETSLDHVINCRYPKTVIIWRHDYASHPRNKDGKTVRKFNNEDEILQTVKDTLSSISATMGLGNGTVLGVVLETLEMKDQLSLVSKCDILIGMHGAGLSHGLFLPRSSGLVEILPSYSSPDLIHFQALSRWRQIAYQRWHNVEWELDKDRAETYVRPEVLRTLIATIYKQICGIVRH